MKRFSVQALAAAVLAVASAGAAQAADVTLRYTHFWPSASRVHTEVFET